jgi:hypothetical protein
MKNAFKFFPTWETAKETKVGFDLMTQKPNSSLPSGRVHPHHVSREPG